MLRKFATFACCLSLSLPVMVETALRPPGLPLNALPNAKEAPPEVVAKPKTSKTKEILTDAAIVAAVIAASVFLYKSQSGGPCACPGDLDRGGRRCGKRSAHDRLGGYSVVCFANEVTADMIAAYRAENVGVAK